MATVRTDGWPLATRGGGLAAVGRGSLRAKARRARPTPAAAFDAHDPRTSLAPQATLRLARPDSGASPAASNSAGDASYGPANPLSSPAEETSLEASASTATNPGEINLCWRFGPSISLTSPAGSDSAEQEASGLLISPAGSDRAGHRSFSPSNSSTTPEASNSAGDASYGPANPLSSPAEETSLEASASTATNPGEINLCWRFGPSISLTSPAGSDSAEQEASGLLISPAGCNPAGHRSFSPSNLSTTPEASNSAGDASYGPANPLSSPAEETSLEASASTATNPGEINLCWRFGPSILLTSPAGSDSAEQEASGLLISPAGSDRAGHRSFSPSNSSTTPEASNSAGDARYGPANLLNGPDEETGLEASASTATTPAETNNIAEHQSFGPSNSSTSPETSTSAEGASSAPANPLSFPKPSNSGEADNYRHESGLVNDVIEAVLKEQQKYLQLPVSEHLVGTEDHVKEIMRLEDTDAFTDTRIIGIYGLGGGQLRELGRSIASRSGSRIWDFEEALKILDNPEGATKIVALHLDKNGSSKLFKQRGLRSLPKLRFLHAILVKIGEDGDQSR
ncbi:hypothetical protein NL676_008778 [Syzygium grande]|nr:hypothetical protein NL676_008778 [Syzygium grande]